MQAVPHDQIDGVAVPAVAVPRTDASCSEANGEVAVPVAIEDGCKQVIDRSVVAVPVIIEDGCKAECAQFSCVAVPVIIEDGCKHNLPVRVAVPVIIEDGCKWDRLEAVLALGRMQARRASEVAVPVIIEDGCK